jgi:hypothetical protein
VASRGARCPPSALASAMSGRRGFKSGGIAQIGVSGSQIRAITSAIGGQSQDWSMIE